MKTLVIVWYLVISQGSTGVTTIPAPYYSEQSCEVARAKINAPVHKGGMSAGYGYCVRAEIKE